MKTRGLFITGTDTGVGKTWVTAMALRDLKADGVTAGAYKPAVTGSVTDDAGVERWTDVERLAEALGAEWPLERISPQRFTAPLAPPTAAAREGRQVDARLLRDGAGWWNGRVELLLVEGVGGLLCPLSDSDNVADLAVDLEFPLLIVAGAGLGTINHTLLTVEAARQRDLVVAGVVLNQYEPLDPGDRSIETNAVDIEARTGIPVLAHVAHGQRDGLLHSTPPHKMDLLALAGNLPDAS